MTHAPAPARRRRAAVVLALLMRAVGVWRAATWWPPSALAGAAQMLAFALASDLGLYLGHRAMHESDALWRVHRVHHAIDTPTPMSTIYIHGLDVTLQAGLPLAFASVLVRPAPAVLYASFALHVAENAVNHLGVDHWCGRARARGGGGVCVRGGGAGVVSRVRGHGRPASPAPVCLLPDAPPPPRPPGWSTW